MRHILIRLLDIILSAAALLVLSPFFLLFVLLIKLTSPGPVFFRQHRVGWKRREFSLIKFRSMRMRAENEGPAVTAGGDSRITKVGKFLRRTKLDELPELWNVLRGDMSLAGPRPEVPRYVKHYLPQWERVFSIRPGITDWSTLQFRDEESVLKHAEDTELAYVEVVVPIKMKLALEYVDNFSLWQYIKVLFLTVWGITLGRLFAQPGKELAVLAIEKIKRLNEKK